MSWLRKTEEGIPRNRRRTREPRQSQIVENCLRLEGDSSDLNPQKGHHVKSERRLPNSTIRRSRGL